MSFAPATLNTSPTSLTSSPVRISPSTPAQSTSRVTVTVTGQHTQSQELQDNPARCAHASPYEGHHHQVLNAADELAHMRALAQRDASSRPRALSQPLSSALLVPTRTRATHSQSPEASMRMRPVSGPVQPPTRRPTLEYAQLLDQQTQDSHDLFADFDVGLVIDGDPRLDETSRKASLRAGRLRQRKPVAAAEPEAGAGQSRRPTRSPTPRPLGPPPQNPTTTDNEPATHTACLAVDIKFPLEIARQQRRDETFVPGRPTRARTVLGERSRRLFDEHPHAPWPTRGRSSARSPIVAWPDPFAAKPALGQTPTPTTAQSPRG